MPKVSVRRFSKQDTAGSSSMSNLNDQQETLDDKQIILKAMKENSISDQKLLKSCRVILEKLIVPKLDITFCVKHHIWSCKQEHDDSDTSDTSEVSQPRKRGRKSMKHKKTFKPKYYKRVPKAPKDKLPRLTNVENPTRKSPRVRPLIMEEYNFEVHDDKPQYRIVTVRTAHPAAVAATMANVTPDSIVYVFFETYELGYLKGLFHEDGSFQFTYPMVKTARIVQRNEVGEVFLQIVKKYVKIHPDITSMKWFLTNDFNCLSGRKLFNKKWLYGPHILCTDGIYDLKKLTKEEIKELGIDYNPEDYTDDEEVASTEEENNHNNNYSDASDEEEEDMEE